MRKNASKSAIPSGEGDSRSSKKDVQGKKKWRLAALMATVLVAFIIRFVFAYGVSAGDNYALSGGSSASSHLSTIISILTGSFSFTDSALNYPLGSLVANPPLYDFIVAVFAGLFSAMGVSAPTAAAGALAWSAPIFSALTCIPVYLVAKRMFKDETIGVIAAVFYATFALLVMTSVFSNGTEYAFVGFLFAWMVLFLYKALEAADASSVKGFKGIFADKTILKNTLMAGFIFLLIALSWSQFRTILTCLVFIMVAQALIDRFRSKDVSQTVGIYSLVILIGAIVPAALYIPAGLWSAVYSGAFLLAAISVAFTMIFAATSKKPWVFTLPAIIVAVAVVLVVMFFATPGLFSDLVFGNSHYTGTLMKAIMATSHNTISSMAAYYGWFTVWVPLMMFFFMFFKYRKNMDSRKYTFSMWFFFMMFVLSWYNIGNAVVAGIGFALSSAALMIYVLRWIDIKGYISGLRGNGFKAGLKKAIKPVPVAAIFVLVALIIAPNAVYAIDGATPTNSEKTGDYFGGLGYTIQTSDSSSMNKLWADYSDKNKSGALVTWLDYTAEAAGKGGFNVITDLSGGGTSAMSNLLLSDGSASATAVMALRLMMSNKFSDYASAAASVGLDFSLMKAYYDDPSSAIAEVSSDIKKYPGIDAKVTGENAVYLVLSKYITSKLCEPDVNKFYNAVYHVHNDKIGYIAVNGSSIPLYYRDGSNFASLAYFNDYVVGDYGAITHFYSYNSSNGYAYHTNAFFETFYWKALIGMSPTNAGMSSEVSYINALGLSDGTVKAIPGYGLSNYKVAYWHVMYNEDSKATSASPGWKDMDAYEAIALQETKGGMINYVSATVLLEYTEAATTTHAGQINYKAGGITAPASGVEVAVFTKAGYEISKTWNYVPTCVVKTRDDGTFKIDVPVGKEYYITVSTGADVTLGGSVYRTYSNVNDLVNAPVLIGQTSFSGTVSCDGAPYTENTYVKIVGKSSGMERQVNATTGAFNFVDLVPDLYTVTVYKIDGTPVVSKDVSVLSGDNIGTSINAKSGKITVTVTDDSGAPATSGQVIATDTTTGFSFIGNIDSEGKTTISVVPSTYTLSAAGGKIAMSKASVTVTADGTKSSNLSVFDARTITVSGAPAGCLVSVMSLGYTGTTTTGTIQVPASGAGNTQMYTAYAISGNTVYMGASDGNSITMTAFPAQTISGILKNKSGNVTTGTVAYTNDNGAMMLFTANSKGEYKALLPAGTFGVYAFDGSGSAFLGSYTVSATGTNDITMGASRTITTMLKYKTQQSSDTLKGLSFADIILKTTVSGKNFTIIVKVDTDGKAVFNVPTGSELVFTVNAFDNSRFHFDKQTRTVASGTTGEVITWTLGADPAATDHNGMYVKYVNVSFPHEVTMTLYNDSKVTYTFTGNKDIMVGKYNTVVKGSTGYYFDGVYSVYPGLGGALKLSGVEVVTVNLTAGPMDTITVTPMKDASGKTGAYHKGANDKTYYVQKGFGYTFTAVSSSTEIPKIAYGSIANASAAATLDFTSKADKVTLKGYAGLAADGTVTMSYGTTSVTFDVKSGVFEVIAPRGQAMTLTADLTQKDDKTTYKYHGTIALANEAVVDGASVRFFSATSGVEKDTILTGAAEAFANGSGSFTLSIKNNGNHANTYMVKSGPAWVLDKTYIFTVNAGNTGSFPVSGKYDATKVGAGNKDLSVIVSDISGNSIGTYVLNGNGFAKGASQPTYIDISGTKDATKDAVSTYEYLYALTFNNKDSHQKTVTFNVTFTDASGKWKYIISDKDQHVLSLNPYTVAGHSSTVVYIKLLCSDASSTAVPAISVTAKIAGETFATNSSSVHVAGDTATVSLTPQSIDLKIEDMNASGTNIYNTASTVPITFWVLMVLCVVFMILVAWEGSKRGVFTRKK